MLNHKHFIFVVPGLSDHGWLASVGVRMLIQQGFASQAYIFGWHQQQISLEEKLQRFNQVVQSKQKEYEHVSLIGMSAGGSAVINLAYQNPNVYKIITICSRINLKRKFSLDLLVFGRAIPTYIESVTLANSYLQKDLPAKTDQIQVLKPVWDEIVPVTTTVVPGIKSTTIASLGHLGGIWAAFTWSQKVLLDCLHDKK